MTLEQLARERGVLWSDRTAPCVNPLRDNASGTTRLSRRTDGDSKDQCVINPYGHEITTASFAMYTFSLAVLVQVFLLVSLSGFADYGAFSFLFPYSSMKDILLRIAIFNLSWRINIGYTRQTPQTALIGFRLHWSYSEYAISCSRSEALCLCSSLRHYQHCLFRIQLCNFELIPTFVGQKSRIHSRFRS